MVRGSQSNLGAKLALLSYFILIGGMILGSFTAQLLLPDSVTGDLPFPTGLVILPLVDVTYLGITLLFARYKGVGLRGLGIRKISLKILAIAVIAAMCTRLLQAGIVIGEEAILGPDPMAETRLRILLPNNSLQLTALIAISLILVGPCEELAFRGLIQKGFENSFGNSKGLLIASLLFVAVHASSGLYTVVSVVPVALVFGYVWQRTSGNTTASALLHGIHNSIGIALSYFAII